MPTPVGPAPPDPHDPDLWDEWYDGDGEEPAGTSFGWPTKVVALLIVIGIVLLFVSAL